jgi:hypothetical protein
LYVLVTNRHYGQSECAVINVMMQPFQVMVIALAGWMGREQQAAVDYLIENNQVLIGQSRLPCRT